MGLQCQAIIRCPSPHPPLKVATLSRGGEPVSIDHANLALIAFVAACPEPQYRQDEPVRLFSKPDFFADVAVVPSSVRVGCQFFYSRNGNRLHVGETLDPDHVDVIFPLTWIRRKADYRRGAVSQMCNEACISVALLRSKSGFN